MNRSVTRDWMQRAAVGLLLLGALVAPRALEAQALPRSSLAVQSGNGWRTVWSTDRAPGQWSDPLPRLERAVQWQSAQPGVEWARLRLAGRGEAWRLGVVLVRLDPRHVRLELTEATRAGGTLGAWSIDSIPAYAALALNAGQFTGATPWGWVVRGGRELQAPGSGPLSMAVVIENGGAVRLVQADSIAAVRARGGVAEAFQSYPALLVGDGVVPQQLRARGRGVDVEHRDSRLAIGELRDGRILIAITRFEGLGGVLEQLPFGPTVPEMAGLMGALGCRQAVLLDGGLSSQLALRGTGARTLTWPGMRRVPLALIGIPRTERVVSYEF
jgi:hypothetical protein